MVPRRAQKNYAFIDGNNLHRGILKMGWKLDYKRFRKWLRERFGVDKAYIFHGFLPENTQLYNKLQDWGYTVVFKPVIRGDQGRIKGNCDAELVLQAMLDYNSYDQAVIVSGDGDFQCLVKHLDKNEKLRRVVSPDPERCSKLLTRTVPRSLTFIAHERAKLEYRSSVGK